MKRILLLSILVSSAISSYSNSFTSLWTGAGLTPKHNFGAGVTHGFTYYRGIAYGVGIGATVFYQKFNMYYDDQVYGSAGTSLRYTGSYAFVSPMFVSHLTRSGGTQVYVNVGVGYNIGGTDSMHKWSYEEWTSPNGKYDSLLDMSKNMKKMVGRVGIGMTHYIHLGGLIKLSITEDVGILPMSLSSTADASNRPLSNARNRFYKPIYYTLRIGFTYRTPTAGDGSHNRKKIR